MKKPFSILSSIPKVISEKIRGEYNEIVKRYSHRDWGAAELNGGRFAEAVFRYFEWKNSGGHFTPFGNQINRLDIYNKVINNTKLPDSLRFQLLKTTDLLFDFRNKRDVAHIGTDIDVKEMDSRFVFRAVS